MAQLSDDCFAFGGQLMPVDEAVALLAARLAPIGRTESIAITDADSRILAQDLIAPIALPPFTNSAVDGYAVRAAELNAGGVTRATIGGRLEAGADAISHTGRQRHTHFHRRANAYRL